MSGNGMGAPQSGGYNPFQSFDSFPSYYMAGMYSGMGGSGMNGFGGFNPFQSFNPPPSPYGTSSGGGMFGYQPSAMGSGTSQPTGGMTPMQGVPNFGAPSMGGQNAPWQPAPPSQAMQNYWAGEDSAMTGGGMQLPRLIIDPATGQAHPMPGAQTIPGGPSGTVGSVNNGAGRSPMSVNPQRSFSPSFQPMMRRPSGPFRSRGGGYL